jgi:hypothetical protein
MARRQKSGGSGLLAGLLAAAIAFLLWARFMRTSSTLSFDVNANRLPVPRAGEAFSYVDPWGIRHTVTYGG